MKCCLWMTKLQTGLFKFYLNTKFITFQNGKQHIFSIFLNWKACFESNRHPQYCLYGKVLQEKEAANPPILLELYILTLADIQAKLSLNLPLKLSQESCKAGVWECFREEAPFTLMNRQEISTKTNKWINRLRFLLEWESSRCNLSSAEGRERPDILAGCCGGGSMLDSGDGSMATNWCPLLSHASQ